MTAAAADLITERGVPGLRITEIAERAGVGAGSFYNHFASMDELVEAVVTDAVAALTRAITTKTSADQDPAEVVAVSMRRFVRLAYEAPDFARLIVEISHADAMLAAAVYPEGRRALREGIRRGRFDIPDLEITLITVLGGAFALMRLILAGDAGEAAEVPFVGQTLRGMGIPAGEALELASAPLPPLAFDPRGLRPQSAR
jgi:AcrR family transcriptional regulator